MNVEIDQLVFGYRNGHELLQSSIEVGSRLQSELLPHVDARFDDDSEHYLVGISVKELDRFMLARIWPAPELPRPGAVWAHALLLDSAALHSLDPLNLLSLFRRPTENELGAYSEPLRVAPAAPQIVSAPDDLVEILCLIGYAPKADDAVVIWEEPRDSENALLAVWRQMPAQTRWTYSFRTRGRARDGQSPYAVQIAAQLAGRSQSPESWIVDAQQIADADFPDWVGTLAQASVDPDDPLSGALGEVVSTPEEAVQLARLWPLIQRQDAAALIEALEGSPNRQPEPGTLEESLFGRPGRAPALWGLSEIERIAALLRHGGKLVEVGGLLPEDRLDQAWSEAHQEMLELFDRRGSLPPVGAATLLDSGLANLSDEELALRARESEVLYGIVGRRPRLLGRTAVWRVLDQRREEAIALRAMKAMGKRDLVKTLIAAEAWWSLGIALDDELPLASVANSLARQNPHDLRGWREVFKGRKGELAEYLATGERVSAEALVAGAATLSGNRLRRVSPRRWLAAGRLVHERHDELAQTAAARMLSLALRAGNTESARKLLIECFGPVHTALLDSTLEPMAKGELEAALPKSKSKDTVQRLNKALIANMESNTWATEDLRRALEPAGAEARPMAKLVAKKNPVRRLIETTVDEILTLGR